MPKIIIANTYHLYLPFPDNNLIKQNAFVPGLQLLLKLIQSMSIHTLLLLQITAITVITAI